MTLRSGLALVVAVVLAGCVAGPGAPATSAAPTTTSDAGPTALDCDFPTTERVTTDTPTPTKSPTGSLSDLTVASEHDAVVTVLLYPEDADAPTVRVTLRNGERVDLDGETDYWRDYRVVAYVGCDRAGEAPAYSYEAVTVTVTASGTVEKTVHAEA